MLHRSLFLIQAGIFALRRAQLFRSRSNVVDEYSQGWRPYANYLEKVDSLEEWLFIKGVEDAPRFQMISGRLTHTVSDSGAFYRQALLQAIREHFPDITSITEYGCGIGRNLLFLKNRLPHLECYGYELTEVGVEVATTASSKFGLPVTFRQLDFARDPPAKFSFPKTDIAFTMFSLEQLPQDNLAALTTILGRVRLGSIHIEPVPENYPMTYRGLIGRVDHRKADYLRNFGANVRALPMTGVYRVVLNTSHNPLMFPSLYVLKK